jgi:hypothetical protein
LGEKTREVIAMRRIKDGLAFLTLFTCVLTLSSAPAFGQQKTQQKGQQKGQQAVRSVSSKPAIWRDPGRVQTLDFANGPGGAAHAPKPPFTFLEEDKGGTNPKIKITDSTGREWGVKWGSEIRSEVFASRLVWAVGYYVEPSYFIKSGRVIGAKSLGRAKSHVSSDGSFTDARFELKEKGIRKQSDKESWSWENNPFVGSREINGLKVMVMLVSNWDPKDQTNSQSNTAIYTDTKTGQVSYVMSDWGATMGKWGGFLSREKWDCDGYADQTRKFVTGVKGGTVEFGYDGKHSSVIKENIRVTDVRWLLGYLGRITDTQIRDALKAADASPEDVNCFAAAVRERINQLKRAAGGS